MSPPWSTSLRRGLGLFALIQLARGGLALACTCAETPTSPTELLLSWDMVFVGEVVDPDRIDKGGCGAQDNSREAVTVFRVTEPFQGVEMGEEVEVRHATSADSCGDNFTTGDRWLMYTDGSWSVCSPGGPASEHADDIDELRGATDRGGQRLPRRLPERTPELRCPASPSAARS